MKIDANTVLLSGKFGTLRFKFTAERGGKEYKPAIQKSTTKVANWPFADGQFQLLAIIRRCPCQPEIDGEVDTA